MTTKEKIIKTADELIRTVGYTSFSYKDISTKHGIKNAAIHYYFPSKTDLGEAVIKHNKKNFELLFENWKDLNPLEKINKLIQSYQGLQYKKQFCIIGALASSADILPESMTKEIKATYVFMKEWLTGVLKAGLNTNKFSFPETSDDKADEILTRLISSILFVKISDTNIFSSTVSRIRYELTQKK